ncbi:MAG: PilW family protein, partial [Sulfuricella sp.]
GAPGCSMINAAVNSHGTAYWFSNLFYQPLTGYENASATAPTAPQNVRANVSTLSGHAATDALAVVLAEGGGGVIMGGNREYRVTAYAPNNFTVTPAPTALSSGELVVATDCQSALLSQATVAGNVITTTGATAAYGPGSRVFGVTGNLFYIGVNAAGEPTLYRQHLTQSGGAPATVAQELVEGVEDMQIMYGVDTTPTADHIVDTYLNANDVAGAGVPGATPAEKWQRVLSVKVNLLMRSTEDGITSAPQVYHYPDPGSAATTPADRRLRRAFTSTIAVRNRL